MHLATSSKERCRGSHSAAKNPSHAINVHATCGHYSSTSLKVQSCSSVNHIVSLNLVLLFPNLRALAYAISPGFQQAAFLLKEVLCSHNAAAHPLKMTIKDDQKTSYIFHWFKPQCSTVLMINYRIPRRKIRCTIVHQPFFQSWATVLFLLDCLLSHESSPKECCLYFL